MFAFVRWRNWIIRGIFTWILIAIFGIVIYGGPVALMLAVSRKKFLIFGKNEIINFVCLFVTH